MYVKERYNRFGELRFECRCSGKHPRTRKNIVYVKTFPVPLELKSQTEIDMYRLQVQIQLKEEVQVLSAYKRKISNAK
ncbi:MAG: hypothetical protein HDQ88_03945 [Clostridia bacterium]|nr:hypothetical protein [Clostridia bacterium]